jgi:hypothetical protein
MKTSALVLWILFLIVFSFVIASCDYESTVNIEPTQKGKGIKTGTRQTIRHSKSIKCYTHNCFQGIKKPS